MAIFVLAIFEYQIHYVPNICIYITLFSFENLNPNFYTPLNIPEMDATP